MYVCMYIALLLRLTLSSSDTSEAQKNKNILYKQLTIIDNYRCKYNKKF